MIEKAPTFTELAPIIYVWLKDRVFTAHSVNFDYSFVRKELKQSGIDYSAKKLCTVRASRKIFPGKRSYSLGRLCDSLNISIKARHRAMGDAAATGKLLTRLMEEDRHHVIDQQIKRNSGEYALPDHISRQDYENIPTTTGIYYFYDGKGNILYIGKAINLKSRIKSHFIANGDKGKNRFWNRIHKIDWIETGSELIALILEAQQIKAHYPPFNKALKTSVKSTGLFVYEDQLGYLRLTYSNNVKGIKPLYSFRSLTEARLFLTEKIDSYALCPKFIGLQQTTHACMNYESGKCLGACMHQETPENYNKRVHQLIEDLKNENVNYWMIDKGISPNQYSLIYVENGSYKGHGYIDKENFKEDPNLLRQHVTFFPDNRDINALIASFKEKDSLRIFHPD